MIARDYAILIGINDYPQLGENNSAANLKGPCNDVDAVKTWLLDAKGGNFPDDSTIYTWKSAPAADAMNAHPTAAELVITLSQLDRLAIQNQQQGLGRRVGRRLYIFMSGHGFSPERQRACLFSADAMERVTFNVHATGWLNWLQDSGYFREYVMWMDCCMNRLSFLQPGDPQIPRVNSSEIPRANFVAFAAQRPLKAVEVPITQDGGKYHGAFTWTLLEGLRGAAADLSGRVTGRSLADWVRNALVLRMTEQDMIDVEVAKEPEIVQEDAGLIFVRGVSKPLYSVELQFPGLAVPDTARLWSGAPPRLIDTLPINGLKTTCSLQPGLYLVEVPTAGIRQGFEVVKPTTIVVTEHGSPVVESPAGTPFELCVDPADPTAEIFVIDSMFSLADNDSGRLVTELSFGLYKIKIRVGRNTSGHVILLDGDCLAPQDAEIAQSSSVIPISRTSSSHEYHEQGRRNAIDAASNLPVPDGGAVLLLMARAFSGKDAPVPETAPWTGITVVDSGGNLVMDLEAEGQRGHYGDPYAFAVKALAPGCYFLRQRLTDGTRLEQSLILCPGWRMEVYVLRRVPISSDRLSLRPRVSIAMYRIVGASDSEENQRLVETARLALADERCLLNQNLEEVLLLKFDNPIAGIIGGHLLLVERDRDPSRDIRLLDTVVRNLQGLLGKTHPDVVALASQAHDPQLRTEDPIAGPPMFQRSWRFLTSASQESPGLIGPELWGRIVAQSALPPLLVWSHEEDVRATALSDLARAVFSPSADAGGAQPGQRPSTAGAAGAQAAFGVEIPEASERISMPPSDSETRARAARLGIPPSALPVLKEKFR